MRSIDAFRRELYIKRGLIRPGETSEATPFRAKAGDVLCCYDRSQTPPAPIEWVVPPTLPLLPADVVLAEKVRAGLLTAEQAWPYREEDDNGLAE